MTGVEFLTGWLAQPIANCAKHTGFCSVEKGSFSEAGGIRYTRLQGRCGVIAQGCRVRGRH